MDDAEPVRIGLVGYAVGGRVFHAPVIAGAAGCALAGVVTRDGRRRADLAGDHPGTPAYDDLGALAAAGVDAVAVSTPAHTHIPLVREAVALGLPVLCDKPFALDAASAREAVAAAEAAGVPLTVYQNRRYDADFRTVEAVLAAGRLGRVTRFESRMEQHTPPGGVPTSGGGILLDLGSHVVDQALRLFGPVAAVHATLDAAPDTALDTAGGVAGRFRLTLRHSGGVVSDLGGDMMLHGPPGPRFRVFGTDGTYDAPAYDGQADALLSGGSPAAAGAAWGVVPRESWGRLHTGTRTEGWPSARGDWTALYTAFADAVRGRGPVPVDPRDAVAGLEVLDAARRSATTGQVVALPA